jgi:hypothetical protein
MSLMLMLCAGVVAAKEGTVIKIRQCQGVMTGAMGVMDQDMQDRREPTILSDHSNSDMGHFS